MMKGQNAKIMEFANQTPPKCMKYSEMAEKLRKEAKAYPIPIRERQKHTVKSSDLPRNQKQHH